MALESGSLSVSATVEPIRLVYVSSRTEVVKIETNTRSNIPPTIIDNQTHQPISPTPKILAQYQGVINSHGSLSAGTYWPITVSRAWTNYIVPAAILCASLVMLIINLKRIKQLSLDAVEAINSKPDTNYQRYAHYN